MRPFKEFIEKYNISEEVFASTQLNWEDLVKVHTDYLKYRESLEPSAIFIFNTLMKSPKVHSVRYRLKDSEHLVEKIIRKKIESPDSNITVENYKEQVADLIGLRALHLFKDDWSVIHDFINKTWSLKQNPTANYRKGDDESIIQVFQDKGCSIKEHKYGYRSIHYVIETRPAKEKFYAEIQVRTIFEEAWSEIDHTIRYPYDLENPIFFQFLLIFNRLAGSADEMGTFIKFLQKELVKREKVFKTEIQEKNQIIDSLEQQISTLNIQEQQLKELKEKLEKLKKQDVYSKYVKQQQDLNAKTNSISRSLDSLLRSSSSMKKMNSLSTLRSVEDILRQFKEQNLGDGKSIV